MMNLYPHQIEALNLTAQYENAAYFYDMGLGKTFVGSEKAKQYGLPVLLICQKSKIHDWMEHFREYYAYIPEFVYDLTDKKQLTAFFEHMDDTDPNKEDAYGVINYELAFRRKDLLSLRNYTLMLDESSLIQNEQAKRTKFILKLSPSHVILLSGTPTAGKYEKLWSQCILLGWQIRKKVFWNSYIETEWVEIAGFKHEQVTGYKNVNHLKKKLAQHGAVFKKTEEVMDLPAQVDQMIYVEQSKDYKRFMRNDYLLLPDGVELIGDNSLTKMLHARQLCGQYSKDKLAALNDLLQSTEDRVVIFYNFTAEYELIREMCEELEKPVSYVNGIGRDLDAYENDPDSVTIIQYQAGSMGGNFQLSNKVIYFTLPLSCENWMQSKKRIHRIGQEKTCFYYYLLTKGSVEEKILSALEQGRDYTDRLFEGDYGSGEAI